jgi:haloalkane dehalogenase
MSSPSWLDRDEYPFEAHTFDVPAGRMHYVDVGAGSPIVFVHGNPSWSYQFRNVIKRLSSRHRCIAPDHLGFGLSDKPSAFSYEPADQAKNLEALLESLDLHDVTLVVNDWGGPIGLSYAIEHPARVSRLVITNTWMWSVRKDWYYRAFSGFMGSALGRYLIRTRNLFANRVVRAAFGTKSRLTPALHAHYLAPLGTPEERRGSWVFPREIIGSSEWLDTLWGRRDVLAAKPTSIVWGARDIAFRAKELARWRSLFPAARVTELADVGHFVSEEAPEVLADEIEQLVAGTRLQAAKEAP